MLRSGISYASQLIRMDGRGLGKEIPMLGIYVFFLFLRALPGQADSEGLATSLQVYEKAADSLRAEIGEMVSGTKDF